ncbi:MAG: acetyl-CoA carboxylase biotin carboxyl carrier protein [Candidatus Rokubacteria bacterium]|nr:acetyl-CoA carboxylase biotin carboxyl carrier protein [Candidatus Rokubacteria bacterium]
MTLKEIKALLELLQQYGLTEIEVEHGGSRVRLRREVTAPTPVAHPSPVPVGAPAEPVARGAEARPFVTVEAPMVGTFYRAPSPDAEPYVREGDPIKEGQVICIIEAMKLMNEVESKVAGRVVKVLVENSQPVEYGQPLFLVEPLP